MFGWIRLKDALHSLWTKEGWARTGSELRMAGHQAKDVLHRLGEGGLSTGWGSKLWMAGHDMFYTGHGHHFGMSTGRACRASVLTSACLRASGASPRHSAIHT